MVFPPPTDIPVDHFSIPAPDGKLTRMDAPAGGDLVKRAQAGSADALGQMYERCAGRLLAYIRLRMGRELRTRLESRDILQATLLKSVEHIADFEGARRIADGVAREDRGARDPRPRGLPEARASRCRSGSAARDRPVAARGRAVRT